MRGEAGSRRTSHVCFKCRKAYRHTPAHFSWATKGNVPVSRTCANCHGRCQSISHKLRVPKADDVRGWEALRKLVQYWNRSGRTKLTLDRDTATRPLADEMKRLRSLKRPTRAHAARIEQLEASIAKLEARLRPWFL